MPEAPGTPAVSPPAEPLARGSRLGRSAALVHGVALAFLASGLLVWWLLQNWPDEGLTSLGVGSVAYFCMALWSVVLSVRAVRNGERAPWPVAVAFAALTEFTAFWVLCFVLYVRDTFGGPRYGLLPLLDKGLEWYVPVWALFLWLTVLTVAPLAWWRVRRAEKKDLRTGRPPWSRRRRWLLGLAAYAALSALLAFVVLPVPVVLYTVLSEGPSSSWLEDRRLVRAMPLWAQRAARFLSARLPSRVSAKADFRLYGLGFLADELLLEEILDPASRAGDEAMRCYLRNNPKQGWALVDRMILGEVTVPPSRLRTAGWLANCAPPSQVIHLLRLTDNPPLAFSVPFALGLSWRRDHAELVPELERLALRKHSARSAVLEALAPYSSEEKIEELWQLFLKDDDPARRQEAARAIEHVLMHHQRAGEKIAEAFWADPDAETRWATFQGIAGGRALAYRLAGPSADFLRKMLALLDDSDPIRRRGASAALAGLLSVLTTATPAFSLTFPDPPTQPETPLELAKRETIRQLAERLLP